MPRAVNNSARNKMFLYIDTISKEFPFEKYLEHSTFSFFKKYRNQSIKWAGILNIGDDMGTYCLKNKLCIYLNTNDMHKAVVNFEKTR